ncbi:MAG TPA: IPT/TIG domain-containing protein, partial [Actinomycetota bacterium]
MILVAGALVGALAPAARAAAPTVSGFSPSSGPVGTSVTITGTGFTGSGSTCTSTTVKFNGVSAGCTFVSTTQLKSTVPVLASTGPISVTNAGGTGTSSTNFAVTLGITISTTSGPPRTVVTVNGSGFAANEAVDLFFDTTDLVLAIAGANGTFAGMALRVPRSAEPGAHWITAGGRRSGNGAQKPFTV